MLKVSKRPGMSSVRKSRCIQLFVLVISVVLVSSSCVHGHTAQGTWRHLQAHTRPILDFVIDPEGTVWLGTDMGLWFVDTQGALQEVEDLFPPGIAVKNLALDREGDLWALDDDGEIKIFDGTHWQHGTLPTELDGNPVVVMFVDSDRNVWIASDHKLTRIEKEGGDAHVLPVSITRDEEEHVTAMFVDLEQTAVWIGTSTGSVWSLSEGVWMDYSPGPNSDVGPINVLYQDPLGRLWAGAGTGAFVREKGDWVYKGHPWKKGAPGHVFDIAMDQAGQVWVAGTNGIGVLSSKGKNWTYLEEQSKALGGIGIDIEMGRDGSIWFGGFSGLIQFTPFGPRVGSS